MKNQTSVTSKIQKRIEAYVELVPVHRQEETAEILKALAWDILVVIRENGGLDK